MGGRSNSGLAGEAGQDISGNIYQPTYDYHHAWVYSAETDHWDRCPDLPVPDDAGVGGVKGRRGSTWFAVGNEIWGIGGRGGAGPAPVEEEEFFPVGDTMWRTALSDGSGVGLRSLCKFDTITGTWDQSANWLTSDIWSVGGAHGVADIALAPGACYVSPYIYVAGGWVTGPSGLNELIPINTFARWHIGGVGGDHGWNPGGPIPQLPKPIGAPICVATTDNHIILTGGYAGNISAGYQNSGQGRYLGANGAASPPNLPVKLPGTASPETWSFSTAAASWTELAPMHKAAQLAGGSSIQYGGLFQGFDASGSWTAEGGWCGTEYETGACPSTPTLQSVYGGGRGVVLSDKVWCHWGTYWGGWYSGESAQVPFPKGPSAFPGQMVFNPADNTWTGWQAPPVLQAAYASVSGGWPWELNDPTYQYRIGSGPKGAVVPTCARGWCGEGWSGNPALVKISDYELYFVGGGVDCTTGTDSVYLPSTQTEGWNCQSCDPPLGPRAINPGGRGGIYRLQLPHPGLARLQYDSKSGEVSWSLTKTFVIPHPENMAMRLRHSCIEAPTRGTNIYEYQLETTEEYQTSEVELPSYFRHINGRIRVYVSGRGGGMGYVNDALTHVVVKTKLIGTFNVMVTGVRKDAGAVAYSATESIDAPISLEDLPQSQTVMVGHPELLE